MPELFGSSCEGSPQVSVGEKLAVSVPLLLRVQLVVPVPEALEHAPVPDHPVKVNPLLGVAVQAPTEVPVA